MDKNDFSIINAVFFMCTFEYLYKGHVMQPLLWWRWAGMQRNKPLNF